MGGLHLTGDGCLPTQRTPACHQATRADAPWCPTIVPTIGPAHRPSPTGTPPPASLSTIRRTPTPPASLPPVSSRLPPIPMPAPDDADETRIPEDIGQLFDVLVVNNNRVCSECFTRLARRERFPDEPGHHYAAILTFVDTVVPEDVKWELLDREYYERVQLRDRTEEAYPTSAEPTTGGTSACTNCGTLEPHRTPTETRSREEAIEDAETLSDTLEEYGITHDEDTLLDTVDLLKRDEDMAGRDHDVYARAVAESVHAALSSPSNTNNE